MYSIPHTCSRYSSRYQDMWFLIYVSLIYIHFTALLQSSSQEDSIHGLASVNRNLTEAVASFQGLQTCRNRSLPSRWWIQRTRFWFTEWTTWQISQCNSHLIYIVWMTLSLLKDLVSPSPGKSQRLGWQSKPCASLALPPFQIFWRTSGQIMSDVQPRLLYAQHARPWRCTEPSSSSTRAAKQQSCVKRIKMRQDAI